MLEEAIVGDAVLVLRPVRWHILTGIAKGVGALHPHLFALQRAFKALEHTEFVVLAVDPDLPVVLFNDRLTPTGQHHPVNRDILGEVMPPRPQGLLDHGQRLNDGLKAILTPKGQML